ncbi:hypothetical protein [Chitinophaga sp. XS-30]|uniref:hypothetical protein n=1 Tax=Chitinophaga sp. XS-30 TaxID=2604421 RepID=UPI0011DD6D28|nr:hypothetical protein [Chitinophaga sp. XS-30]QEH43062.1 hypothetical protein FW415_20195 [Chitinophaga sp. XS-30]
MQRDFFTYLLLPGFFYVSYFVLIPRLYFPKKIPGASNALGQSIPFDNYQFEILVSDIRNPNIHAAAIIYTTRHSHCWTLSAPAAERYGDVHGGDTARAYPSCTMKRPDA